MTGPFAILAGGLVFAGSAVMVCSALLAVGLPAVFDRLHLLSVTTSVGVPVVAAGLIIAQGWTAGSAMVALITVVVLVTAPVMSAATARLTAQRAGLAGQDSPP